MDEKIAVEFKAEVGQTDFIKMQKKTIVNIFVELHLLRCDTKFLIYKTNNI